MYIPVYWLCGRYQVYCSHKTATISGGETDFLEDKQELSDFEFDVAFRVTAEVFRALKPVKSFNDYLPWADSKETISLFDKIAGFNIRCNVT